MTVQIGGSSPEITFADSTVQNTAALPLTGGAVSADITVHGLTVGLGGGSVSTNTALGVSALGTNSSGAYNTAVGDLALTSITSSSNATGVGYGAGQYATGSANTAIGNQALTGVNGSSTGTNNTAIGANSLYANTSGSYNTGLGFQSLTANTTASYNTAIGYQAGYTNQLGGANTFIGNSAGFTFAYGSAVNTFNTFIGNGSGSVVTTGIKNTIPGSYSGNQGSLDIRTSNNYIVLSDGDGNPRLYMDGGGYLYSPVSYGNTTANASNMWIGSSGIFGRSTSALKYKTNVRDFPEIDITKFRPVVYNSNCEGDDKTVDHFGFIADEVDQAGYKQLVSYNSQGEVEGFQYERMTAVLTQQVQQLLATVTALQSQVAALQAKVGA